jgi:hypothetical protein
LCFIQTAFTYMPYFIGEKMDDVFYKGKQLLHISPNVASFF